MPSAAAGRTPSTTSRSCPRGARATPRRSAPPGRSTPTASTSRCWPRRWTRSCRRPPRSRWARWAASGCSTSRVSGRGTTTRPACSRRSPALAGHEATRRMQEIYTEPIKPELITERLKEVRAAGVTVAGSLSPQRTKEPRQGRRRRRRGHVRHPRHHRLRRAREQPGRAAQPQGVHLRARRPGDRGRVRDLPGRAPPDAHRCRRRARRLRRRCRPHDAHGPRRRRADGQRRRRRRRRPP